MTEKHAPFGMKVIRVFFTTQYTSMPSQRYTVFELWLNFNTKFTYGLN